MDRDALGLTQQFGRQRPAGPFGEPPAPRLADDDLGDVVAVGVIQDGANHIVAAQRHRSRAQLFRQFEGLGQARHGAGVRART